MNLMTLTEVSYYARKYMPFAILSVLVVLILYYSVKLTFIYIEAQKPVVLPLDTSLGKIIVPQISKSSSSANLKFKLDTVEGEPVIATEAAKVFFIPKNVPRFGYLEKIALVAKTLGFEISNITRQQEGNTFSFQGDNQSLSIDNATFNFTYDYDFQKDQSVFTDVVTPQKSDAERTASDFLKKIGRYPDELAQGKTNTIFMKYDPVENKVTPLQDRTDANLVEVDFYRPDIEGVPVVTPGYFNSQNYVMMVFYGDNVEKPPKILRAQIKFFDKSSDQVGFYPLKSGKQAYEELSTGSPSAQVVSNKSTSGKITIKKLFLGYFDPEIYQEFLQPVFVFVGSDDFVGYVPAISSEYAVQP